jgi:CRISPR-associated endonuclease/helicase Cas3
MLLHARYYPEDREAIEGRLDRFFGPKAAPANVILVTTQVVEAGMDISADQLHTEIAPMNALIQRAGRTARYEFRNLGSVTVYETKTLGPYRRQAEIVEATRRKLNELPADGRALDFAEERAWIHAVHANQESQQLQSYSNLFSRRRSVIEAMDQGHRGKLTELVRDISSVGVLIAENPEDVDFGGRAWPRLLGVPGISLMTLSEHFGNVRAGQWVAKGAEEQDTEGQGLSLTWRVLSTRELMAQWLVALHPDFASYHPRIGLVLGRGGAAPPIQKSEPAPTLRYQYKFEPWSLHARRITHQANAMRRAYSRGAGLLARRYRVSAELIEELVEVICILHDTGKLTEQWQKRAWIWQNDKDARMRASGHQVPPRPAVPLAHTWFDTVADRRWQRQPQYALPHHAVEGAFAVAAALQALLGDIGGEEWGDIAAACGYTSIARHHGPRSMEFRPFQLSSEAQKAVAECLPFRWRELSLDRCNSLIAASQFSDELLAFAREEDEKAWPLYVFLVRRLRLADQASLRQGDQAPI